MSPIIFVMSSSAIQANNYVSPVIESRGVPIIGLAMRYISHFSISVLDQYVFQKVLGKPEMIIGGHSYVIN